VTAPPRVDLDALTALLRSRRSVRRFRPDPPPRALVERCLEAAILAPSASNAQPWRFFVVESREAIARMAAGVRAAVERIARAIEPAAEASFRAYGDYFTRFEGAPLVVAVLWRRLSILSSLVGPSLDGEDRARIERMERGSGAAGAALALENLLLAAHAAGLGA
jgi:nitroreductase